MNQRRRLAITNSLPVTENWTRVAPNGPFCRESLPYPITAAKCLTLPLFEMSDDQTPPEIAGDQDSRSDARDSSQAVEVTLFMREGGDVCRNPSTLLTWAVRRHGCADLLTTKRRGRLREVCVEAYYLDNCLDKEEPGRGSHHQQSNFPGGIGSFGN
jgi:hypothetical protein